MPRVEPIVTLTGIFNTTINKGDRRKAPGAPAIPPKKPTIIPIITAENLL